MRWRETQKVPFRLIQTQCCGTQLCWVNPRLPMHCPECGKFCYPAVKGWVTNTFNNAMLVYDVER
jgi:hypothetical protein